MIEQEQIIYRVIFEHQDKFYEIYAKSISEGALMGFIEIEEIVFSDSNAVLIDPAEERLRSEFKNVKRSYVPLHSIIRIDEVMQDGIAKLKAERTLTSSNISPFPAIKKKEER